MTSKPGGLMSMSVDRETSRNKAHFLLLLRMVASYNPVMESIIRNVKDIEPDKRCWLENAIGKQLEDNQKIVIRVLTPGVEPDEQTRDEALADLRELSRKGSEHRESMGVAVEEADEALDEAMDRIRSRKHQ